jgi:hypothetical protein
MRFLGGFCVSRWTVHRDDYAPKTLERCRALPAMMHENFWRNHEPTRRSDIIAVVRELPEEVGVLLCVNESGEDVDLATEETKRRIELKTPGDRYNNWASARFAAENLYCDDARAVYFDHWVTPEIYSMRFDTRFRVATLPSNQVPLARSEEVTHSLGSNLMRRWHA